VSVGSLSLRPGKGATVMGLCSLSETARLGLVCVNLSAAANAAHQGWQYSSVGFKDFAGAATAAFATSKAA